MGSVFLKLGTSTYKALKMKLCHIFVATNHFLLNFELERNALDLLVVVSRLY